MTTPSGQISLNDVNVELGIPGTTLITMNDANVRTLAGVGGSGTQISMQNLQGKSNRVVANITIASDTTNYTFNTAKVTGYSAGKTDATLTINPGVYVYSTSTGSYALTVDTSWTTGDTVTIVNNGTIVGDGGNGGNGGNVQVSQPPTSGGSGGPALLVQRALTMNNLNRIAGGGGGGGGGNGGYVPTGPKTSSTAGGGGGGGGIGGGSGGSGGGGGDSGSPGGAGTVSSAGNGGGGASGADPGGNGGGYGSSGSAGGYDGTQPQAGGGGAGACIVGNSNITYTNTGTRNGSIS